MKTVVVLIALIVATFVGYSFASKKTTQSPASKEETKEISLEGKVEKFETEGRDHVSLETEVKYNTNPPTSGSHLSLAENWGIYAKEIDDRAAVHALEHGGIWISYKDLSDDEKAILEEIGRGNPQSTIVSPRSTNEQKIAVVSWGKMMKLDLPDKALIQKYIDTYKNQSPEKLAK